eukprot:tig00021222_g19360.t1
MKNARAALLVALGLLALATGAVATCVAPPPFENTGRNAAQNCYRSTCDDTNCYIICSASLSKDTGGSKYEAVKPDLLRVWVTKPGVGNTLGTTADPDVLVYGQIRTNILNEEQLAEGGKVTITTLTHTTVAADKTYYLLTYKISFSKNSEVARCSSKVKNFILGGTDCANTDVEAWAVENSGQLATEFLQPTGGLDGTVNVNCMPEPTPTPSPSALPPPPGPDSTPEPPPPKVLYPPEDVKINPLAFSYDTGYPATVSWTPSTQTNAKTEGVYYKIDILPPSKPDDIMVCPYASSHPAHNQNLTETGTADIDPAVSPQSVNYLCPGYTYTVIVAACTDSPVECKSATVTRTMSAVAPTIPKWNNAPIEPTAADFTFPAGTAITASHNASYDGGKPLTSYTVTLTPVGTEAGCPGTTHDKSPFEAVDGVLTTNTLNTGLSVSTYLCPGNSYTLAVKACNAEYCSDAAAFPGAGGIDMTTVTAPAVAPVCGVPLPATVPSYISGPYGGQSVKSVDQLKALFPDIEGESPLLEWSDIDQTLYGFKDAVVYWPKMAYQGEYNITLFRYIRGANGYAPDKYQTFYVAGTLVDDAVNFAYATNIQPTHCYGISVKICNAVGCCTPSSNPPTSTADTTAPNAWFQPSQNFANKNSREPTDRTFCVAIKPLRTTLSTTIKSIGIDFGSSGAGVADASSAAAARSASTASTSGTSNTLLAVAIAVPVGVAGLAIGAVLAAMVITRNQVRAATMAAVGAGSRGQTLNIQPASFDSRPRSASTVMLMGPEEEAQEAANMRHREPATPEFDV